MVIFVITKEVATNFIRANEEFFQLVVLFYILYPISTVANDGNDTTSIDVEDNGLNLRDKCAR